MRLTPYLEERRSIGNHRKVGDRYPSSDEYLFSLIVLLSFPQPPVQPRTVPRFCIFAGRISYSTYLFHLLVATILIPQISALSLVLQIAIYAGVIAVATFFFYLYFERPILDARPHYAREVELPSDRELADRKPAAAPQNE